VVVLDQQQVSEGQVEALDWMDTRRACDLPMVRNYKRMRFEDKTAQRDSQVSGYAMFGDRICTKKWISYAHSSISIPISVWSVYLFLASRSVSQ
jgi:hypothetical protein